jgi:hypothetical protein
MSTFKKKLRTKKRKTNRAVKAGFWPFTSSQLTQQQPFQMPQQQPFQMPQQQPIQSTSQWKSNSTAPNWSGPHRTVTLGDPNLLGYRFMVDSQGRGQSNVVGIPQHIAFGQWLANPGPQGRLGGQDKIPVSAFTTEAPVNYYGILGVSANSTPGQIQSAYLAKKNTGTNTIKKNIQEGYAILSDPTRRKQYDINLSNFYHAHPPNMADLSAMYNKAGQTNPVKSLQSMFS